MTRTALKILVADDDRTHREIAHDELALSGHDVRLASDGAMAIELLALERYDAAIIDLNMPSVDGISIIRQLRAGGLNSNIPIVVVTGHDDGTKVDAAYAAGATSFLTKPLDWKLFRPHVAFVLRSAQADADLRETQAAAATLSQLKSRVMAALATEFQAPIKSIFGFSQLISKQVYGPIEQTQYREMADDMARSAHQLNSALLKLMDFGHTLNDWIDVRDDRVPARKIVLDAVSASESKAQRRDITLDVDLDIPPRLKLRADRALLYQALRGVLDDAIRLSPRGGKVQVRGGIAPDGRLTIELQDVGPPASAELVAEINAWKTAVAPRPADASGWRTDTRDVGVKIARVLAEAHQGALDIASGPGKPNIIRMSLPANRIIAHAPMDETAKTDKLSEIGAALTAHFAHAG